LCTRERCETDGEERERESGMKREGEEEEWKGVISVAFAPAGNLEYGACWWTWSVQSGCRRPIWSVLEDFSLR